MTRPAADRVKAVWTGTGTGSMVLGGAASGEPVQGFPSSLNGQVVRYLIKHETAQEAEAGYGTYTSSTTTLTRTYRTYPTPGGSAVSFSAGTKFVSVTPLHIDFVPNITTIDPTPNDDISIGYLQGHIWINTAGPSIWMCRDHTDGVAVWAQLDTAGGSGGTLASQAEAEAGSSNTVYMSPLRTTQNVTARIATQGEAEGGTDNTKLLTALRVEQHHAARQSISRTGFNPASVLVDDDAQFNTYVQSGAVGFSKAEAGTFRRGKLVTVTFDSDASALTWDADFENFALGAPLPSFLPDGLHTLGFTWNSHRAKIQVAIASLFADGTVLGDYSELTATQTGVTGAVSISALRKKHTVTHGAGNITPLTITGWPVSGLFGTTTVDWKQDATGGRTVALPTGGVWAGGTPTFNTAANKVNRVTYTTENAGTTVVAHYGGDF